MSLGDIIYPQTYGYECTVNGWDSSYASVVPVINDWYEFKYLPMLNNANAVVGSILFAYGLASGKNYEKRYVDSVWTSWVEI